MKKFIVFFIVFFNFLYAVDSFSTKEKLEGTKANLYNGAVSEHISTTMYKKNGYTQVDVEVGRNGIDGLFIKKKKDGTLDIISSEVKHGNGKLGWIKDPKDPTKKIKQMSKEWHVIKIEEKIKSLGKVQGSEKEIKKLETIKDMVKKGKVKTQITRVTNLGDDKYTFSIDELRSDGKLGRQSKHRMNDTIIDLKKQYKAGSEEWKIQKTISHSVRKEKRLLKEGAKLKDLYQEQKMFGKGSKEFKAYTKKINKQKSFIRKINKSRPEIFKNANTKTSKSLAKKMQKAIPAVMIKKGKKVLAFMDAKAFKNASKFKKLEFLKNVKGGDVVMMALEGGVAVYTLLHGGMTYKKVSALLLDNTKSLVGEGFSKCACFIAPPAGFVIAIAGTVIIDYAIDKYIELDKRGYVGLEDMLWDVPDEIKNKITVLNLEDTKRETVFDFSDIDKETILDDEQIGETILENEDIEKETILDI